MVAQFNLRNAVPNGLNDACAFVAGDNRHRITGCPLDHMPVAVADAARRHLDQDFAGFGRRQRNGLDAKRGVGFGQECGLHLHGGLLSADRDRLVSNNENVDNQI